jgi:hypothetical protein
MGEEGFHTFPEDRGEGPPPRERGHWCTGRSHQDLDRSLGGEETKSHETKSRGISAFSHFHFLLAAINSFIPSSNIYWHNIRCQPLQEVLWLPKINKP